MPTVAISDIGFFSATFVTYPASSILANDHFGCVDLNVKIPASKFWDLLE